MARSDADATSVETEYEIPPDLPSFACIEFPGTIVNFGKAIETLGGKDNIQDTLAKYTQFEAHSQQQQDKASPTAGTKPPKEPFLELHLNPNGVFDHALFGKIRRIQNCILIKKTTKVRKHQTHDRSSPAAKIEVLGRIRSMVTFDELADFQVFSELNYPTSNTTQLQARGAAEGDGEEEAVFGKRKGCERTWSLRDSDIPRISEYPLVPPVFASKAAPYDGFLKLASKPKAKAASTTPSAKEKQTLNATLVSFARKNGVPKRAKANSVWRRHADSLAQYVKDKAAASQSQSQSVCERIRNELVLQARSYLSVRPVWTKSELVLQRFHVLWRHVKLYDAEQHKDGAYHDADIAQICTERKKQVLGKHKGKRKMKAEAQLELGLSEKQRVLGKVLGVVCFKFRNGPFRNSVVKFGFDPRDKAHKNVARPLQMMDYRISKRDGDKLGIESEWTGGRGVQRGKPKERRARSEYFARLSQRDGDAEQEEQREEAEARQQQAMLRRLRFEAKPNKLGAYYQYRNIGIKGVQRIIHNDDAESYNKECDAQCGWIRKADDARIRELMDARLESWMRTEAQAKAKGKRSKKKRKRTFLEMDAGQDEEEGAKKQRVEIAASASPDVNEDEDEKRMEVEHDEAAQDVGSIFDCGDEEDDVFQLF